MRIFFFAALLTGSVLQAQPYRIGNGVKPPSIVSKHEPEYTDEARLAGAVATVVVALVVNEQGEPESLRVVAPVGMGLDESAIHTVESWQFKPGTKDDRAVPVIANIEVNFRLLSPGSSLIPRRIVFDNPSQPGRPVLKQSQRIALSRLAQAEAIPNCVTVRGTLASDGALSAIRFDPAVADQTERELLSQLGRWSFEPAAGTVRMEFCAPAPVPQRAAVPPQR